jgi:hypothetical protein
MKGKISEGDTISNIEEEEEFEPRRRAPTGL